MLTFLLVGCSDDAKDGKDAVNTGTLTGTVSNALTGDPLADAVVSIDPDPDALGSVSTGADGSYVFSLPVGNYTVTVAANDFVIQEGSSTVLADRTTTADVALDPVAPVIVEVGVSGSAAPGSVLTATVDVRTLDGSTVQSTLWSQSNSVDVEIESPSSSTTDVALPGLAVYKDELLHALSEPPITEAELPPNVELPEGEFPGGTPNRFGVVGVNPFALEESGAVTLKATVETDSGIYSSEISIHAAIPFKTATGLHTVPIGIPVILNGRAHVDEDGDGLNDDTGASTATYNWALVPPLGSNATLVDATSKNPHFIPDSVGQYTVTVTDTTRAPGTDVITMVIDAGRWVGAITGQDSEGRPAAAGCVGCHTEGGIAPDNFTPWSKTGHAEIFTDNLNTSTHYGESCFPCHTVGFDPDVDNDGFDDAPGYQDFLSAGLLNNPGDNWTKVINQFPSVALEANIQCENCHGPQFGTSHPDPSNVRRTNLSADVCATCHGEPLRHARFQQWQLSGHANYELATDEGTSGSCARCHTANGFLTWLPVLLDDDPETDPTASISVTWTADQSHPQTCATCHDPHSIGTTTGIGTNATVRISGDTPPLIAGFTAIGVGKGAICMTCHNSRRGLRNDSTYEDTVAAGDTARAPHGSSQTDVLMGQNAYFVEVGVRGNHSLIEDTCVNCHMEQTPPPDALAYSGGGTNHTFAARDTICSNCHGASFTASGVQGVFAGLITELKQLLETAIGEEIASQIAAGNTIELGSPDDTITDAATIAAIDLTESHGRQAITVTFTDSSVVGPVRLSDVAIVDPGLTELGELYDFIDDRIPRAGWNFVLASNDGSRGVHNPAFVQRFLSAAIAEVNAVLGL